MLSIRWLPVVLCLSPPAFAQPSQTTEPADLARQTLAAIDIFAEHHIAAPPRQEIVRQMIFAMRRAAKLERPLGLGPRLGKLSSDEEFLELLTQEWEQVRAALLAVEESESAETVMVRSLQSLLFAAPGRNAISGSEVHRAEQQLAANRYVGIGIQLVGGRNGEPPRMVQVFPAGPAHAAGGKVGDVIVEIDGISTDGMTLVEVVRALRGPEGTEVELLLQQGAEEPRRYTITRGVVPIQHTFHERVDREGIAIEVIRFNLITPATVSDLRKIEQEWTSPPDAVLIDLQRGADDLHHGVLLADALLDGGEIGRLVTADGSRSFEAGREALFADIPLFVIVSGTTSGALEWVAAALQDQGRATVIGQPTAGQAFVSESFDVPGTNLVLTLATGVLQRADGRDLVEWESSRQVPHPAVHVRLRDGTTDKILSPAREGPVVPVRTIATPSQRPTQSEFAGREFIGGPVTVEAVIEVILPLLNAGDDAPESD
jgi:C-terminal peptidase prc